MLILGPAKIAASLNYSHIGAAPRCIDPQSLEPDAIEKQACDIPEPADSFPASHLCEVRADWKFMKAVCAPKLQFLAVHSIDKSTCIHGHYIQ